MPHISTLEVIFLELREMMMAPKFSVENYIDQNGTQEQLTNVEMSNVQSIKKGID